MRYNVHAHPFQAVPKEYHHGQFCARAHLLHFAQQFSRASGTVASGVAIATRGPLSVPQELRFLDPPALGQTMAHELGHLLGLYHTSEYDGVTHDALPDTIDNDDRYLMHPDGLGSVITPDQKAVMMNNPQIYHAPVGSAP